MLSALVCFILSKTAFKNNPKCIIAAKKLIGEYTFMGLMFGAYMIAVSFVLEIMYGIKSNADFIGKVSLAECSILLTALIGYFIFLLVKPEFFG